MVVGNSLAENGLLALTTTLTQQAVDASSGRHPKRCWILYWFPVEVAVVPAVFVVIFVAPVVRGSFECVLINSLHIMDNHHPTSAPRIAFLVWLLSP